MTALVPVQRVQRRRRRRRRHRARRRHGRTSTAFGEAARTTSTWSATAWRSFTPKATACGRKRTPDGTWTIERPVTKDVSGAFGVGLIWGTAKNDVYSWKTLKPQPFGPGGMNAVWASSVNDVYFVGGEGKITHGP